MLPPVAEKIDFETGMHGDKRNDEYYWMADYFKKGPKSDDVINYLNLENEFTQHVMTPTNTLQEALFAEMKGRIKEDDASVPVYKNGYFYYTRTETGKQYYKYCRKKDTLDADEELLLDVDSMALEHPYFSVTGFNISPNNNLLAFGVDTVSRREYTIYIKDLVSGELLSEAIFPTSGNSVWANDNQTLFYTENNPETLLTEKIKKHKLGQENILDVVVYHEEDSSNYIGVNKSKSGEYIFICSAATLSSEWRYLHADKPDTAFQVFQSRQPDLIYNLDHQEKRFLVHTNFNALNFRLMETDLDKTGIQNWRELIPHRNDVLIEDIEVYRDFLVITERENGLILLKVINLMNSSESFVDFGEPTYSAYSGANPEYSSSNLRFIYTSLTTPASVFDYNMISGTKQLMKQQEVVGGYSPADYESERCYAIAEDGTKIPISIVYKKGFNRNSKQPLLLYGYGSYGHSIDAGFSSSRLSLLNRGFSFAIAHIRGGQEMGRQWYEDGKLLKKMNTFSDFIACATYLIEQNYTSSQHLYAEGGSAGGLLMGAIVNLRPDLWNGILADVPFVDVVTTMLDENIPLTTNEFDEWGNPKKSEYYHYMKSYSPYDNVKKLNYPNILITTGLHDSQVQYFEPAKWIARLRTHITNKNLLLLKTNMEAGHGGASGRFDYLKEIALQYAFLFMLEEIKE